MSDHTPWPLIAKYLAGESSEDEKLAMEWWLEEVDNRILFEQVKAAWLQQSAFEISEDFNPETGINRLNALISGAEDQVYDDDQKRKFIRIRSWLVAASIIFLIGFGYLFISKSPSDNEIKNIAYVQKVSGNEQILSFVLPDGSKVWLNKNSKIIFPSSLPQNNGRYFLKVRRFLKLCPTRSSHLL